MCALRGKAALPSDMRGFRGPGNLVSFADWMLGTAGTPVSLSHYGDEG